MKLLLKRDQAQSWAGTALFKLWGKIEFDELEDATIRKYRFDEKILIEVEQITLMRNAAIVGVLAFVVAYAVLWLVGLNYIFLAIVLGAGGGYFYFHQMRETIFVKDIMHGRYFTCRSVIELAQKEAELERIVKILRQVMEAAKHWDGTETIEVPVLDKDSAKQLIVQLR